MNSYTLSVFSALEMKKLVLACNAISLDIPVMNNISYDLIKILHEKMLNAINIFVLIRKRYIS